MDSTLSWKHHLQKMCNKIKQRIGIICRIRNFLDEDMTLMLYNALILPLYDYCDVVYGNCNVSEVVKLQRLQNRAAKIILQVPFDTGTHVVLSKLKWFYLAERLFFHRCVFLYKCFNGASPAYLARSFSVSNHGHNTRSSYRRDLQIPKCKTACGQRTLAYQGVKDWNSLSITTRTSNTLETFKSRLKLEILAKRGSY